MRTVCGTVLPALFLSATLAAERPWREITVPSVAEVAADFPAPPPESGMVLWWGWDGPVTEEVIIRDLDAIKALGFPSVMLEAGYGMSAPYLSPGWFELVRLAVHHARRRGMRVWIEDEGKYPSGFAGGKFTAERPDLRMQALVVAEKVPVAPGQTLSRKLPPQTLGAIAVNLADNSTRPLDAPSGELRWTAPEGNWEVRIVQHQFRTSPTRAVNNPTRGKDTANSLCDYLNPAATRQFLAWTHEQYKKYIGHEFGRTFLGFMGDEPDYSIQGIPWTPSVLAEFQQRKGYDVRPYLAAFLAPRLTEEARRAKADYWDVWSDLFRENFFRVQAEWCARNNLDYKVHLNHEDQMMGLVRSEGDYFKNMRYVQVPGIDAIWNQIWPDKISDFPKLASSAAHLFGRPRAFSESFAAYKIRPTVEQAKWVIDHQLARGINFIQIMFYPSSASGPRRSSGMFGSVEFPAMARYVTRASYLLSMGRPAAQIAVYHPTTTMWLGDEDADKSTLAIVRQLLERQRDFDFVDEQALSSLLTLQNGALRTLSGNACRAILVPGAGVISRAALDRLRAFAKSGGRVVFLGRTPSLVADRSIFKAGPAGDFGWALVEPAVELTPRVLEALPPPDVALDQPAPSIEYVHRRWRDADLYFFFNESEQPQSRLALLAASGQAQVWDAAAGRISALAGASAEKNAIRVPLQLGRWESKFIVIGVAAPPQ